MNQTRRASWLSLLGWLAIAFAAGGIGAIASVDAAAFYARLVRPGWAPPASVFGPVWTILYTLMGIAAWLVWRSNRPAAVALLLFIAQLLVNALWSWLFFAWHQGAWAMVDVSILLALILATTVSFWPVHRLAAALLMPYLGWVAFATALTWAVWRRNPNVL